MCGIVGAIARRDVVPILLEGLRRLEYRGYDSAGIAVVDNAGKLARVRAVGKIHDLQSQVEQVGSVGCLGIGHTRWATHGRPSRENAHPHISGQHLALVHNGIIENHRQLREELAGQGARFDSQTDSEVIVHLIRSMLDQGVGLLQAVQQTLGRLQGAYAIAVIDARFPDTLVAARVGSPLVVGIGVGEYFLASDALALAPVTSQFIFLEEGDCVEMSLSGLRLVDPQGTAVQRPVKSAAMDPTLTQKGNYRHFMLKEIHEQPIAIADTLEGRLQQGILQRDLLGERTEEILGRIDQVKFIACGTSYHAGLVGCYWGERLLGMPMVAEIASEFRYRRPVVAAGTLCVFISQSGETSDTLAARGLVRGLAGVFSLAICNVPESSLVRAADLVLMTHAGPEIGVASTKAFTAQLTAIFLLILSLGQAKQATPVGMDAGEIATWLERLQTMPGYLERALGLDDKVRHIAEQLVDKQHALFLGRGIEYPLAMEGALKMKEISYIHAEAYPAGELKHGPLALVDEQMPVIAVAPSNDLLEKLQSNLQEVKARGGQLFVVADQQVLAAHRDADHLLAVVAPGNLLDILVFTIPLQLLAYHVAVLRGTDVDQPRNLAKSVTVE